jgi:hypothetical protein
VFKSLADLFGMGDRPIWSFDGQGAVRRQFDRGGDKIVSRARPVGKRRQKSLQGLELKRGMATGDRAVALPRVHRRKRP